METKQTNLNKFIASTQIIPTPVFITQHIIDRKSFFKAAIFKLTTSEQLRQLINFANTIQYHHSISTLKTSPTHNCKAWRFLHPSDSNHHSVQSGYDDDGERWAGRKILNIMEKHATIDAFIVVSRWYGGTMLGPIRFQHIESVSVEACKSFRLIDEFSDKTLLLHQLELDIKKLRQELNEHKNKNLTLNSDHHAQPQKRKRDEIESSDTTSIPSLHLTQHPPTSSSSESFQSQNFDPIKLQNQLNHLNKLLFSKQKSLDFLQKSITSFKSPTCSKRQKN